MVAYQRFLRLIFNIYFFDQAAVALTFVPPSLRLCGFAWAVNFFGTSRAELARRCQKKCQMAQRSEKKSDFHHAFETPIMPSKKNKVGVKHLPPFAPKALATPHHASHHEGPRSKQSQTSMLVDDGLESLSDQRSTDPRKTSRTRRANSKPDVFHQLQSRSHEITGGEGISE